MKKFLILSLAIMICIMSFIPVSYAEEVFPDYSSILNQYEQYSKYEYMTFYYGNSQTPCLLVLYDYMNYSLDNSSLNFEVVKRLTISPPYYYAYYKDSSGETSYFAFRSYTFQDNKWNIWQDSKTLTEKGIIPVTNGSFDTAFVTSTVDIYDSEGNLFFPVPLVGTLAEKIQAVTNQEMTTFPTTLAGVMKILALCGVGCLALLMVLPLFGKVLNRYR